MTYLYQPSFHDYGPRGPGVPIRAVVVHMAEGGGTVGYLAKQNPNGVSVHYVVEYTGRIVRMLSEAHVNGSINPRDIRTTDDEPYTYLGETVTYGATAAHRALGSWHDDPNRVTLGIEVEGFASQGPNKAQRPALAALVAELHGRYHVPILGHRDFADYKACPGRRIDWPSLGGHASMGAQTEGADMAIAAAGGLRTEYRIEVDAGTEYYVDGECTKRLGAISKPSSVTYVGAVIGENLPGGSRAILVGRGSPLRQEIVYVKTAEVGVPERQPADLTETRLNLANNRLASIRTLADPV